MQSGGVKAVPLRLRADARRNRERILAAAREVFAEQGPDAPLDEIARRAQLGIGTLYRRFPNRASLIRQVVLDVLTRAAEESAAARGQETDAFAALARYMHRMLELRIGVAIPPLLGRVSLAEEDIARSRQRLTAVVTEIIDAARQDGTLRPDVTFGDIGLVIMRLSRPLPGPFSAELDSELAHRQLDLLIDGLRADRRAAAASLTGPALSLDELRSLPTDAPAADLAAEAGAADPASIAVEPAYLKTPRPEDPPT
jgi:AcrR family transcriptional regulator